jgi:3-deoxy-D-manno-octulosonic-acid transferase
MTSWYDWLYRVCLYGSVLCLPFSKKLRQGFLGRRHLSDRIKKARALWTQAPFWFHVASSGELEQCLPILDELKRRRPDQPLFVSYFSPTAKKALELEAERRGGNIPWDYADYAPFDLRSSVKSFIDALTPQRFVAINREIWPGLLEGCRARNIPSFLFACYFARRTPSTFRLYGRWLALFQAIGVTEPETAAWLKQALPDHHIDVMGDPRVERVLQRKALRKSAPWADFFQGQNVFVGASLWNPDFLALQRVLPTIFRSTPRWRVILTPHEPKESFIRTLVAYVRSQGGTARRWSNWMREPDDNSHLIVDTVGVLAELYCVATVVFVGGSFRARVHNVLEPAAYGRPVLTGPFIQNSSEAVELSREGLGVMRAATLEKLVELSHRLLTEPELRERSSNALSRYLEERQGASERYARLLLELE